MVRLSIVHQQGCPRDTYCRDGNLTFDIFTSKYKHHIQECHKGNSNKSESRFVIMTRYHISILCFCENSNVCNVLLIIIVIIIIK